MYNPGVTFAETSGDEGTNSDGGRENVAMASHHVRSPGWLSEDRPPAPDPMHRTRRPS
jgi:hypothetical protein